MTRDRVAVVGVGSLGMAHLVKAALMGAAAMGVRNVLALRGDDPKQGDQPDTKPVFDLDAKGLLLTAARMRDAQELPSGRKIGSVGRPLPTEALEHERLGIPVAVTTFAPMAENMVSGRAMRPGDVLTMYGGRTVEVLNTDAEGRLILADALVKATEAKPDVILDVATLTGHMVLALGERIGGVMGSDDVVADVLAAGETAGEAHWPMPITDDLDERIRSSKVADLAQHDWIRWGGGLYAGAFLREFTAGLPWGHLDIAGPAFNSGGPYGHVTAGGTGFGVPTLVEFARAMARRFTTTYRTLCPNADDHLDPTQLDWHRRLHALRILVEMSGWDGDAPAGHPWLILGPIARQILDRPRGMSS